jgi:hypothetical protein
MMLTDDELKVLIALRDEPDGTLRTKARPTTSVKMLAEKHAIVNVLTTSLSGPGRNGGTSIWRLTETGRALIDEAHQDADRSAGRQDR